MGDTGFGSRNGVAGIDQHKQTVTIALVDHRGALSGASRFRSPNRLCRQWRKTPTPPCTHAGRFYRLISAATSPSARRHSGECSTKPAARTEELLGVDIEDLDLPSRSCPVKSKGAKTPHPPPRRSPPRARSRNRPLGRRHSTPAAETDPTPRTRAAARHRHRRRRPRRPSTPSESLWLAAQPRLMSYPLRTRDILADSGAVTSRSPDPVCQRTMSIVLAGPTSG